jgi:hypothetical protein
MSPVGFKLAISAAEQPQTYALDRAATGTDKKSSAGRNFYSLIAGSESMEMVIKCWTT